MKLAIVAVGQRMPEWVQAGFDDYARRIPKEAGLKLVQVKPEPRGPAASVERLVEAEARRIRSVLPAGSYQVVLDERGRSCTSRELARRLADWQMQGRQVAFVIGGPDGLDSAIRRGADWVWSLAQLTLPHGLVRIILAEQLYRAFSILKNHPYHRE